MANPYFFWLNNHEMMTIEEYLPTMFERLSSSGYEDTWIEGPNKHGDTWLIKEPVKIEYCRTESEEGIEESLTFYIPLSRFWWLWFLKEENHIFFKNEEPVSISVQKCSTDHFFNQGDNRVNAINLLRLVRSYVDRHNAYVKPKERKELS